MSETKLTWLASLLTFVAVVALVRWLMPGAEQLVPVVVPVQLPPAAVVAKVAAAAPAKASASVAPCSLERLNGWTVLSVGAGAYREPGFAVLFRDGVGSLTVQENAVFDGNLRLRRIGAQSADLACDAIVQTRRVAGAAADATDSSDPSAVPAMRTALPAPPGQ